MDGADASASKPGRALFALLHPKDAAVRVDVASVTSIGASTESASWSDETDRAAGQ